MPQYDDTFKKKIVRPHLEEGCTLKAIATKYRVSKTAISNWIKAYRE